ncbi:hypothetical protein IE81DRAFT_310874 [Ceraceosorus guamensis]|uniref:Glycopeptide n=1 Tax=Ceraceosorus guamensis TaxID=1522189 RepID=A0A316W3P3_9BASI|nr:hypothetical protein IE81DRAFT_310874 [Ceraceosorus guamensis]PWN44329.1 hypothetical protein IE81DRAFT_310874 [Ceraceosorus guamensis]
MQLSMLLAVVIGAVYAQAAHHISFQVSGCSTAIMQVPGRGVFGAGEYDFDGDVNGIIASAGNVACSQDGVPCTSIEASLNSGISSADITLIPPHQYSAAADMTITGANPGAAGNFASCHDPNCPDDQAFHQPTGTEAISQRQVNDPNSGLIAKFTC